MVWLLLLFEMLDNIFAIICYPVYDEMNFEVNVSCLIKLFLYITKKSEQNVQYLKNEKSL